MHSTMRGTVREYSERVRELQTAWLHGMMPAASVWSLRSILSIFIS